jgi:hypothetical protein
VGEFRWLLTPPLILPLFTREAITWLDTDVQILQQLTVENGDIFEMFPCHIYRRAGIDTNLLKSIVSCATKGIGPGSFSDILARNHHALWHSKEKKWTTFINRHIAHPSLCVERNPQNHDDIAKCPKFTSDEIRVTVSSPSWLVQMFCTIVDHEYVDHYLSYYKKWQKNQDRKQAISAAKCELVLEALGCTPAGLCLTHPPSNTPHHTLVPPPPLQPHSMLGPFSPQWALILRYPWPSHGMGMHYPLSVLFGSPPQVPPMKRTHQQLPSPASMQQKRKKKRTCQVPHCSNPNSCIGSEKRDRCPSYYMNRASRS